MPFGNTLNQRHSSTSDGIGVSLLPERLLHTKGAPAPRRLERRRTKRIACSYPVHWSDSLGTTHDLNEFGVLFETDRPLKQDKPIKLGILIPSTNGDEIPVIALCEAKVVRVEKPMGLYNRYLVAATFSSLKLH